MKIAIIGAGASGLATAKHAVASGHACEIIEMRPQLGGTWLYTGEVGRDCLGYPVHSATYKSLKANLPKDLMCFQELPAPSHFKEYGTHADVLKYLEVYAEHFNLKPLIKFNQFVTNIQPDEGTKWKVTYESKIDKEKTVGVYDVVIICVGNCNEPYIPDLPGMECFKGGIHHSREYRTPEPYEGQNVLVIGGGPSGLDLTLEISTTAAKVIHSHHSSLISSKYPENVEVKRNVRRIHEKEVEFEDGSTSPIDTIYFCTGYVYSFPFLDASCGLILKENYLEPLYKHMIHARKPTMCFIGVPIIVCAFPMFDLQARFYMKYLEGAFGLPPLEEIQEESERARKERDEIGFKKTEGHKMDSLQGSYYDDLAAIANIESLPPVAVRIMVRSFERYYEDVANFRNDVYTILDDENYTHIVTTA